MESQVKLRFERRVDNSVELNFVEHSEASAACDCSCSCR